MLLPIAVLVASVIAHPVDLTAIAVHLLLFPNRVRTVAEESWRLRRSVFQLVSKPRSRIR